MPPSKVVMRLELEVRRRHEPIEEPRPRAEQDGHERRRQSCGRDSRGGGRRVGVRSRVCGGSSTGGVESGTRGGAGGSAGVRGSAGARMGGDSSGMAGSRSGHRTPSCASSEAAWRRIRLETRRASSPATDVHPSEGGVDVCGKCGNGELRGVPVLSVVAVGGMDHHAASESGPAARPLSARGAKNGSRKSSRHVGRGAEPVAVRS